VYWLTAGRASTRGDIVLIAMRPEKVLIKPLQALNIHLVKPPYHTTNQNAIQGLEKQHSNTALYQTIIDYGLLSC
jgi:hypothetical protein